MNLKAAMESIEAASRESERQRCAAVARDTARAISKGAMGRAGSVEEVGERIAAAIERGDP